MPGISDEMLKRNDELEIRSIETIEGVLQSFPLNCVSRSLLKNRAALAPLADFDYSV